MRSDSASDRERRNLRLVFASALARSHGALSSTSRFERCHDNRSTARSRFQLIRLRTEFVTLSLAERLSLFPFARSGTRLNTFDAHIRMQERHRRYRIVMLSVRLSRLPNEFARSRIVALDKSFLRKIGVLPGRDVAHQIIAKRVGAVFIG